MIDMLRKYRTRDGREVRIYATDGSGCRSIHGAYKNEDGWHSTLWTKDGRLTGPHTCHLDLIEVKPRIKRDVWANVYPDQVHCLDNRGAANFFAHNSRLACIKITIDCEEGEGL